MGAGSVKGKGTTTGASKGSPAYQSMPTKGSFQKGKGKSAPGNAPLGTSGKGHDDAFGSSSKGKGKGKKGKETNNNWDSWDYHAQWQSNNSYDSYGAGQDSHQSGYGNHAPQQGKGGKARQDRGRLVLQGLLEAREPTPGVWMAGYGLWENPELYQQQNNLTSVHPRAMHTRADEEQCGPVWDYLWTHHSVRSDALN